jgi:Carboxypeptidase regulatory-like domain
VRSVAAALGLILQAAIGIDGLVLDPQGRGVPNAAVTLSCGDTSRFTVTDRTGRFTFASASRDSCSIDVRRTGFTPLFARLIDHAPGAITLRLQVAPVVAEVRVTGRASNQSPFGLVLSEDDFKHLAAGTDDLIRLAQARAGAAGRSTMVYVDGLPASTLPPLDMIARVAVNTDPFSAEFAHGDMTAIHITTRAPSRRLRFYTGGTGLNIGGSDALGTNREKPDILSGNFGVMGPVPRVPLTFMLTGSGSRDTRVTPVSATLPTEYTPERDVDVTRTNRNIGGGLELNYAKPGNSRARLIYREYHSDSRNSGAGELSLLETGTFTQGWSRDVRLTANRTAGGRTFEFGASATVSRSDAHANSTALGISVPGEFVSGGNASAASSADRTLWTVKQVVRSGSTRPWSAGFVISSNHQSSTDQANPSGMIEFASMDAYREALNGAPTGTLVRAQDTAASYQSVTASPFVQKVIWRGSNSEINAGLRGDYQRGFGTIISPRLSAAVTWRGTAFAAGSGLFARDIPHMVEWGTVRDASNANRQRMAHNVSLISLPTAFESAGRAISSQLDPGMSRPREWMSLVSAEKPFGKFTTSVGYSRAIEGHLLGSRRDQTPGGWLDTIESNRRASRDRVHAQLRFEHQRQHVSLHYEWTRAHDDTAGPWSFAENQDDLASEWARSSRTAPQSVTLTGTFALPGAVTLNATNSWLSGAPYNVTTGIDESGNGLRNDRGGRPRNSAQGPASNDLSVYAHRRFVLPDRLVPGKRRFAFSMGIHGSNLLNNRNSVALGSVVGTPAFGKPTAALPGRAMRITFSID